MPSEVWPGSSTVGSYRVSEQAVRDHGPLVAGGRSDAPGFSWQDVSMSMGHRGLMLLAVAASFLFWTPSPASAANCAEASTAEGLHEFFRADDAAGLAGADYPHAIGLPDGRTLWYFQDAFFGSGSKLDGEQIRPQRRARARPATASNHWSAPGGDGDSWIGSWVETDLQNWLWPLDAELGADGHLWLFLAEVQNPNGDGAARGALPVGTWVARYTYPGLRLVGMEPGSRPVRGRCSATRSCQTANGRISMATAIASSTTRGAIGFDADCSPHAYLARVPVGQFDQELEYWTSTGWSDDRGERTPVLSSEISMPVSVQRFGDVYVAASDEGDWFGDDVVVYTAPAPQGPWVEALRYTPETALRAGLQQLRRLRAARSRRRPGRDRPVEQCPRHALHVRAGIALPLQCARAVDVPGASSANLTRQPDLDLARRARTGTRHRSRARTRDLCYAGRPRSHTRRFIGHTDDRPRKCARTPGRRGNVAVGWCRRADAPDRVGHRVRSGGRTHRRTLDATKPSTPPARDPVGGRRTT